MERTERENKRRTVRQTVICAVICGLRAAKHQPPHDRDCILILGCGFNQDGTLPPLLRGRADAAIAFRSAQIADTGKVPLMLPSGGQGSDEPMPEAQAIRRYLIEQGIPESEILTEEQSTTTLENMRFSKKLMDARIRRQKPPSRQPIIMCSAAAYGHRRQGWMQRASAAKQNGGSGRMRRAAAKESTV